MGLERTATTTRGHASGGFTLIEVMVALVIVALLAGLGVRGLRSLAKSDLRASTGHLGAAMRYLFDRASTTGRAHRLVVDLDAGRYWAEVSDDRYFVPREKEDVFALKKKTEEDIEERKQDKEKMERAVNLGYDPSRLEAQDFRPKRARFAAFKEVALKPQTLRRGAKIAALYTPRSGEAVTEGKAYVYFFPMGQAEAAIIMVTDAARENTYSLVVHPLTGRVMTYDRAVEIPAAERYDDTGERIVE